MLNSIPTYLQEAKKVFDEKLVKENPSIEDLEDTKWDIACVVSLEFSKVDTQKLICILQEDEEIWHFIPGEDSEAETDMLYDIVRDVVRGRIWDFLCPDKEPWDED